MTTILSFSSSFTIGVSNFLSLPRAPRTCIRPCVARFVPPVATSASSPAAASHASRVAAQLRLDLPHLFSGSCDSHYGLYIHDVEFEDPLTKFRGISRYRSNIEFLRQSPLFTDTELNLYDVNVVSDTLVRTRWMLCMTARFPWRPRVIFTGTSDYVLNDIGEIVRHVDCWDSLQNSHYFSREAIADLAQQLAPGRGNKIMSPMYKVLRRMRDFEIRKYETINLAQKETDVESCLLFVEEVDEGRDETTAPKVWMPAAIEDNDAPRLHTVAVVDLNKAADCTKERKLLVQRLRDTGFGTAAGGAYVVQYRPGVNSDRLSRELWVPLADAPLSARKRA